MKEQEAYEKTNADEKSQAADSSSDYEEKPAETEESIQEKVRDINEKYLRLYADFENYKRKVQKDKEELLRHANESMIYEILPVIDSLEMALAHSNSGALAQGVENTLRELKRTLEKFGLTVIEAQGRPFDPSYHHAMSQVEREDIESNIVIEEYRKGYIYKDKVLRPSLVIVSKNTAN